MNQGPIWGRFMKKTRGQKSRATVPLRFHKRGTHHTGFLLCRYKVVFRVSWNLLPIPPPPPFPRYRNTADIKSLNVHLHFRVHVRAHVLEHEVQPTWTWIDHVNVRGGEIVCGLNCIFSMSIKAYGTGWCVVLLAAHIFNLNFFFLATAYWCTVRTYFNT